MKTWVDELPRLFGPQANPVGKYSQSYQDSLLDFVFENLAPPSYLRTCVEFGFNSKSLIGGSGANVAKLVVDHGWKCWLFDAENENPSISLFRETLTPGTITRVFDLYGVPREAGYISIDVDSIDYWLFAALLKTHRPLVFSVEYNSNIPLGAQVTLNLDAPAFNGSRRYGASLSALTSLAKLHDYFLLWVIPGLDAFFVRKDVLPPKSSLDEGSARRFHHTVSIPNHPRMDRKDLKFFADVSEAPGEIAAATGLKGTQREVIIRALVFRFPVSFAVRWKFRRPLLRRLWKRLLTWREEVEAR